MTRIPCSGAKYFLPGLLVAFLCVHSSLSAQQKIRLPLNRPIKSAMLTPSISKEMIAQIGKKEFDAMQPKFMGGKIGLSDSIVIAFQDVDKNNSFDDVGTDLIIVANGRSDSVYSHLSASCKVIESHTTIRIHDQVLKFNYIDKERKYASFTLCDYCMKSPTYEATIKFVDTLPYIDITLVDESSVNLKSFTNKGKLIFLHVWGAWCGPCIKEMPELQDINTKYSKVMTLINLDFLDQKEEVKKLVREYNMNWTNGYSTKFINSELLVLGYPYGILFDEKGKLIKNHLRLNELRDILSKRQSN